MCLCLFVGGWWWWWAMLQRETRRKHGRGARTARGLTFRWCQGLRCSAWHRRRQDAAGGRSKQRAPGAAAAKRGAACAAPGGPHLAVVAGLQRLNVVHLPRLLGLRMARGGAATAISTGWHRNTTAAPGGVACVLATHRCASSQTTARLRNRSHPPLPPTQPHAPRFWPPCARAC